MPNESWNDSASRHVTVIENRPPWQLFGLRDLWRHRELLYMFTWRDIKVRYKQTVLGILWSVVGPVATMLVFTFVFGKAVGLQDELNKLGHYPYQVFVLAGLLPWQLFSRAMGGSGMSIVTAGNLINKVYFPRLIIPIASMGAALVDFAITFCILLCFMLAFRVYPGPQILLLPVFILLIALAALSVGVALSALTVNYRDVRQLLPFLTQTWMYLSPIIYPASIFPERWRWAMYFNPMTGIIEGFRFCIFPDYPFQWQSLGISAVMIAAGLTASVLYFRRMESTFADVV